MKHIPFDISLVEFEKRFENEERETEILYFTAPKEWLNGEYPDAAHSEIRIEYPIGTPDALLVWPMMSPTRIHKDGNREVYDWFDIDLSMGDVEALILLAKKECV